MLHLDLNNQWLFSKTDNFDKATEVCIPHSNCILPYNYVDENDYQFVSYYKKVLDVKEEWLDKKIILKFDGVAHKATFYVNSKFVCEHNCGYTAFSMDISSFVKKDENEIKVVVDSRETLNVPPFNGQIDYLTYGGIYREVSLEVLEDYYIADVFARGYYESSPFNFAVDVTLNAYKDGLSIKYNVMQGISLLDGVEKLNEDKTTIFAVINNVKFWSITQPNMASVEIKLFDGDKHIDTKTVNFGFRTCKFTKEGFFLNGEKIKLVGLNRHQSYPYVGYAMPARPQILDAQILKYELGVNAVRTSHYPQSQHFIDECDKIGLLVFTEIPGWQHIGDNEWQEQAKINTKEMVMQYRNHPSIILWGVRINESADNDELYIETNRIAHELDETRQTGGVRCIQNSHLFEDVYTYNDFLHKGDNRGTSKKKKITKTKSGYLVSEFNGHMFPTKAFDDESHRLEQALRHANVMNSYLKDKDIAGGFGWCMFDYNTHKDFGSGDKICYHGVLDMFRNKKVASYVYSSQMDKTFLQVSSTFDRGEYPMCYQGDSYIFTNADSVKMYRNDIFVKEYLPKNSKYSSIKHPPILIDDYLGDTLITEQGFTKKSSNDVKSLINYITKHKNSSVPFKFLGRVIGVLLREKITSKKLIDVVVRYMGGWGTEMITYRFDAIVNGEVLKTVCKRSVFSVNLDLDVDTKQLTEGSTFDVATVRIKAVDFFGNVLPYYNEPVVLKTSGCLSLIGPNVISLKGGLGGTFVKTVGEKGNGTLTVSGAGGDKVVKFTVK